MSAHPGPAPFTALTIKGVYANNKQELVWLNFCHRVYVFKLYQAFLELVKMSFKESYGFKKVRIYSNLLIEFGDTRIFGYYPYV